MKLSQGKFQQENMKRMKDMKENDQIKNPSS
jgi:hypothetical protein